MDYYTIKLRLNNDRTMDISVERMSEKREQQQTLFTVVTEHLTKDNVPVSPDTPLTDPSPPLSEMLSMGDKYRFFNESIIFIQSGEKDEYIELKSIQTVAADTIYDLKPWLAGTTIQDTHNTLLHEYTKFLSFPFSVSFSLEKLGYGKKVYTSQFMEFPDKTAHMSIGILLTLIDTYMNRVFENKE